jgi:NADH-quinone oxidoreductase subunit G
MEVNSKSSPRVQEAKKISNRVFIDQSPIRLSVCDQAGECDLQNLSFDGKSETRFRRKKNF